MLRHNNLYIMPNAQPVNPDLDRFSLFAPRNRGERRVPIDIVPLSWPEPEKFLYQPTLGVLQPQCSLANLLQIRWRNEGKCVSVLLSGIPVFLSVPEIINPPPDGAGRSVNRETRYTERVAPVYQWRAGVHKHCAFVSHHGEFVNF